MNSKAEIDRDLLSVVTGALLLSLALARFVDTPVRSLATTVFGSQVGLTLSATTLMLLITAGMAVAGMESLVRTHPLVRQGQAGHTIIFWIAPALLALALAGWLERIEVLGLWTAALLAGAVLIPLALAAEYAAVDPKRRGEGWQPWAHTILIHLIVVGLLALIYDLRARSLLSGPAVFLVTTLLAARLLWPATGRLGASFLYGGVVGLALGEMIWMLNYWRLSTLRGGLLLLLFFYVTAGLLQQYLTGRFGRQVVLEYLGITALSLLVIALGVQ
ncbi:MAG: hypothetical protein L0332_07525 [Chloroflexi bacterium]|nr:hypothetical protein [Chloroflexota bacterium]MCI0579754.1 hypothetical protein [Chloroflexota bacterium]MCI0648319.1 hypothetical protein [Chloroflexota bacterium]MCI0726559.1 hypothetical protein [Chloroflexota bacterium]